MSEQEFEELIQKVYRIWKSRQKHGDHPDEEEFGAFIDGKLDPGAVGRLKSHLVSCRSCASLLSLHVKLLNAPEKDPSAQSVEEVMRSVLPPKNILLAIVLRARDTALEILSTTGDVLCGQELVPGAVLRSREQSFRDEITVLKDFSDVRIEVKVENTGRDFRVAVRAKDKQGVIARDIRISLFREGRELESYVCDEGNACFEHVALGKYCIEIASGKKMSTVALDIVR